jgi:hypothetical protein
MGEGTPTVAPQGNHIGVGLMSIIGFTNLLAATTQIAEVRGAWMPQTRAILVPMRLNFPSV